VKRYSTKVFNSANDVLYSVVPLGSSSARS
jgi:hypothetical protein